MEEVIVNHSLKWKIFHLVMCGYVIAVGTYLLRVEKDKSSFYYCFLIALFCLSGLYNLYQLLRERVGNKPYLIITDKSIVVDKIFKRREVFFSDVEYFSPRIRPPKIEIHYREGKTFQRTAYSGKPLQEISTNIPLTIKNQALCNLLNERVQRQQRQNFRQ